jgi:hypothetical protein
VRFCVRDGLVPSCQGWESDFELREMSGLCFKLSMCLDLISIPTLNIDFIRTPLFFSEANMTPIFYARLRCHFAQKSHILSKHVVKDLGVSSGDTALTFCLKLGQQLDIRRH